MKPVEVCFSVVLFIVLLKVVLTFESEKKIHNWYQMIQREIRKQTVQEFDYEIPIKLMKNLQTTDKVSEMSLIASPPPWNTMTLKASLRQISRM